MIIERSNDKIYDIQSYFIEKSADIFSFKMHISVVKNKLHNLNI